MLYAAYFFPFHAGIPADALFKMNNIEAKVKQKSLDPKEK
jgi:hypothetical protein